MINNKTLLAEASVEELVAKLLSSVGENPQRSGLKETPKRVAKAYKELLSGYNYDPKETIKLFDNTGFNELVTLVNIEFYSLCEHHMIPFFGKVHIGYVPGKKVLGLSKFARVVDMFSRRLQTQENLTKEISDFLDKNLKPKGLIILIEAKHLCVSMRGIKKNGFVTKTCLKKGLLTKREDLFRQFYKDIQEE